MNQQTKLIVSVSIHFMILFTAFNAFQTIVTKIHQDEGDRALGPFRFTLNYSTFMIANLFVSKVKYSEKWQITISTLTYVIHYLTGFFVSGISVQMKYTIAAFGAIINGIGGSFLWTSIGSYIHKVCHIYDKQHLKGHYFGLFNTIFCLSTILGALVVTFGLSLLSPNTYFILVSSVAFLAFIYGIFFIKDIKYSGTTQPQQNEQKQQKRTFFNSARQSAISTIKFYPIMKYTLGLIILDGTNVGVVTSTMLHLMPTGTDQKQNNFNAGLCLILFGVGCVIGGYLGGKLCDRLKIRLSSTILMYCYWLACLVSIAASQIMAMWSAMISCFLWGFVLYYITSNLMVISSRLYEGKPESFALTKQFHCVSFIIYQIVAMTTNNSLPVIYIMIVLCLLGVPAILGICNSPQQKKHQYIIQKQKIDQQIYYRQNQYQNKNNQISTGPQNLSQKLIQNKYYLQQKQ